MTKNKRRWVLAIYDVMIPIFVDIVLLDMYRSVDELSAQGVLTHGFISFVCIFSARILGNIYQQIWRYGGIQCYIRLLIVDGIAFAINLVIELAIPLLVKIEMITFARLLSIACMNLLCSMAIRMIYQYAYKFGNTRTRFDCFLNRLLYIFTGEQNCSEDKENVRKIKLAIIGAGRVGVTLDEELMINPNADYIPPAVLWMSAKRRPVVKSMEFQYWQRIALPMES